MIKNVIFDFGGVLINWDPRHLYRKIFSSEGEIDWFLNNVCTSDWNEKQDEGRLLSDATAMKIREFPDFSEQIEAYYGRWEEMLVGPFHDTVKVLEALAKDDRYRVFGLTNWSGETFPIALMKYDFLQHFEDILVSGDEGLIKPNPRIFHKLLNRNKLKVNESLFLDDNIRNVEAARGVGLVAVHYKNAAQLIEQLGQHEIDLKL